MPGDIATDMTATPQIALGRVDPRAAVGLAQNAWQQDLSRDVSTAVTTPSTPSSRTGSEHEAVAGRQARSQQAPGRSSDDEISIVGINLAALASTQRASRSTMELHPMRIPQADTCAAALAAISTLATSHKEHSA